MKLIGYLAAFVGIVAFSSAHAQVITSSTEICCVGYTKGAGGRVTPFARYSSAGQCQKKSKMQVLGNQGTVCVQLTSPKEIETCTALGNDPKGVCQKCSLFWKEDVGCTTKEFLSRKEADKEKEIALEKQKKSKKK